VRRPGYEAIIGAEGTQAQMKRKENWYLLMLVMCRRRSTYVQPHG